MLKESVGSGDVRHHDRRGTVGAAVPVPLCVGMAAAGIAGSAEGVSERERIGRQRDFFVEMVRGSRHPVAVNGVIGELRDPGNANLRFDGLAAQDILGGIQPRVAASTGAACTSGIAGPSHVLRALGLTAEQADSSIRFSFRRFTNDDEVKEATFLVSTVLRSIAQRSRPITERWEISVVPPRRVSLAGTLAGPLPSGLGSWPRTALIAYQGFRSRNR